MDACIGTLAFYLFGFCIAYGDPDAKGANVFLGVGDVALDSESWNFWFFQWAFAATAATSLAPGLFFCIFFSSSPAPLFSFFANQKKERNKAG